MDTLELTDEERITIERLQGDYVFTELNYDTAVIQDMSDGTDVFIPAPLLKSLIKKDLIWLDDGLAGLTELGKAI